MDIEHVRRRLVQHTCSAAASSTYECLLTSPGRFTDSSTMRKGSSESSASPPPSGQARGTNKRQVDAGGAQQALPLAVRSDAPGVVDANDAESWPRARGCRTSLLSCRWMRDGPAAASGSASVRRTSSRRSARATPTPNCRRWPGSRSPTSQLSSGRGSGTAARLLDRRFADGRQILSVDSSPDGSYRIDSPGYGVHVVAAAGDQVTSWLPADVGWRWQRLFVAQALPLAASIRGLEPLHASAVTFGRGVVAFSAPSGTGKTSIVTHLVAGGGRLVTDDVLAVEARPDALYAHPGARLLNAARHEVAAVGDGRDRLGGVLASGDGVLEPSEEVFLRPPLEQKPLPLVALYRLLRVREVLRPDIAEEVPPSPPSLLSTIFLMHLKAQTQLERRLEVLSRLAKEVRVFNVRIPADLDAQHTACAPTGAHRDRTRGAGVDDRLRGGEDRECARSRGSGHRSVITAGMNFFPPRRRVADL